MVFADIKPLTARPRFGYRPYRDDQVYHLQGCNRKLEFTFGWLPTTRINEGLQKTIQYEKKLILHSS
jgi:dTDP-D-glucose 4,6-dehydratase